MSSTKKPAGRRAKPKAAPEVPAPETAPEAEAPALEGDFIAKEEAQALVLSSAEREAREDEEVVERVEHLNKGVGWVLISAGVIGLLVPGVLGTPFLIMGAMALWPGNRKTVERWRQGHSPKMFHGAMRQINRFLDDLERRYPRLEKKK